MLKVEQNHFYIAKKTYTKKFRTHEINDIVIPMNRPMTSAYLALWYDWPLELIDDYRKYWLNLFDYFKIDNTYYAGGFYSDLDVQGHVDYQYVSDRLCLKHRFIILSFILKLKEDAYHATIVL